MKRLWLIAIPALLVLAIGGFGCGQSQQEPKTTMEQKVEKKAAAPMMEESKEMAEEAAAPAMEQAPEAAEEAKAPVMEEVKEAAGEPTREGGALMDSMKEKVGGEAQKAMDEMEQE